MRGKAQPHGRPDIELIETPRFYYFPVVDESTRATPLFE